ncbi:ABC transporter substrate-binding protein [Protofrankia coriariae]|uniref:ABC transporter substrate-binding protein n=1 Tax=Protofrankia coriariae TaxID=1562887 RepID=UPI001F459C58|nr:ABC transporter substrate-binding protein [Protofrankia coriariae]
MTSTEVKAGLLYSNSGPGASPAHGFRSGVQARFDLANAEGGVNGRKLSYVWRDDATDPALNLVGARQLVEDEKAFGIMQGLQVAAGSAQYLGDHTVPVTGFAAETVWSQHQNMFSWHYYTAANGSSTVWGDFASSRGGTRAAMVDMALSDSTRKYHQQVVESLRRTGISVDMEYEVTAGTTSFDALARQMKAARIDTIAGAVFPDVLAKLIPAVRAAGVDLRTVLIPAGYDQTLLRQLGPLLAGVVVYVNFVPYEQNPQAYTRMLGAMSAYTPENQSPTQEGAVFGWLSADMFVRGLREAGPCPTRQSFIDGLRKVHDYNADGLLPRPLDLSTNFEQLSDCFTFVQVSDDGSQFVPLPPSPRCGKPLT